jgi:hypothetical protein
MALEMNFCGKMLNIKMMRASEKKKKQTKKKKQMKKKKTMA